MLCPRSGQFTAVRTKSGALSAEDSGIGSFRPPKNVSTCGVHSEDIQDPQLRFRPREAVLHLALLLPVARHHPPLLLVKTHQILRGRALFALKALANSRSAVQKINLVTGLLSV